MINWRYRLFLIIFLMLAAIIIGRLFYVQIFNRKFYQSQALGQQVGFKEVKGNRGEIFSQISYGNFGNPDSIQGQDDKNGLKSLAINRESWSIFAIPKQIENKDNFTETLGQSIKESKESILSKLNKSDSYAVIKKDLSKKQIEDINKLKLKGLYSEKNTLRYYPESNFASQVVGFLGGDGKGQYGLEGYYDNILQGKSGIREEKRGLDLIDSEDTSYLNGSDIFLTIDYNIQFQAELLLKEAAKNIGIDSGQVIVMKPDSGRILAMANYPSFDLNKYSKESLGIFQNATIQKIFEPGSVMKPFTMAMALNEGKVSPETKFQDEGFVKIGPDTIYNFDRKKYDSQDMSGILEKSINTGAVFLSQLLSNETFLDYMDKFGFNSKTNIDLQGEVYSKNDVLKAGYGNIGKATASYGQGIEMTPIQLIRAFSVFANQGKIVKPYIVERIVHNGEELKTKPEISDNLISQKTATEVTKMMINVVDRGYGTGAKINGYYLAGKTGTAQVPIEGKKGYYPDKTIQSFIGFGPALKPQFLIFVKLDNPEVPQSSLSAAPIFKKLAQYIINYWQIPPDY